MRIILDNSQLRAYSSKYWKSLTPFALACAALVSSQASAKAAQIDFSYSPGTSWEQILGMEIAGAIWSDYLADDVTVNLYVQTASPDELPKNVIGGALPGIRPEQPYETWRNKFESDRTSNDDRSAFANLQDDADKFTALIDGNKIDNNEVFKMTRANAKAIDMLGSSSELDGVILINDLEGLSVEWHYDFVKDSVPDNSLDFLSTALHEVGHSLGFVSGVDQPGWLDVVGEVEDEGEDDDEDEGDEAESEDYDSLIGNLSNATPLDMFRYSQESVKRGGKGAPWFDLSIGADTFFSVNGGKKELGDFSTGKNKKKGGDGYQGSHWEQQNDSLGVMDPFLKRGERKTPSTLDQQAFDVIGWDLESGGFELEKLQAQEKEELADKLWVSLEWLEANPELAAEWLSENRDEDVEAMIEDSEVYKWGWSSSASGSWAQQEGLWQHVLWQEVEGPVVESEAEAARVPEPRSIVGLLGLGLLGFGSRLKHRGKR